MPRSTGSRIVQAARETFAERGLEVTLDDIGRRAGVGVGTVYRRFACGAPAVAALEITNSRLAARQSSGRGNAVPRPRCALSVVSRCWLDVRPWLDGGLDWVIAGGESGPDARPMHPDWARELRDQCRVAGVAFSFTNSLSIVANSVAGWLREYLVEA